MDSIAALARYVRYAVIILSRSWGGENPKKYLG